VGGLSEELKKNGIVDFVDISGLRCYSDVEEGVEREFLREAVRT
jgi:hypothetical protein